MDSRRSAGELADIESSGNKSELSISRGEESVSQAQDRPEPQSQIKSRAPKALERIASRITTRSIQDPGPPPDGGIVAWTQIACAWLAITNSWGFVNSFGAFQPYYETILPVSASTISWIGSIQAGLLFIVGVFSGRALDYGWFRPTVALGIAVQLLGIFAMSASSSYWQLLLTQGVCTGIGGGIFFLPMMGVCSTYFAKNRGIAIGIVTTGNSIGGVVYPLVVRQLLGKVGFGWTVRVLGFINVVCLLVAFAFMKPRLPPRKAGNIIDMDAIRDLPYCLHVLGICFLMPPVYCVFYYVASFARDTLGMPYTTSLNMVIIVNGVGLPARILPGWIADRYLGVLNVLIICVLCNIIVLWSWLAVDSIPAYYVWTVCYGLVGAAFQSLFTPAVATYSPDITKTGTRLGMAFCTIGGAALVGGPISGALLISADGNYKIPIAWASASTVAGWTMITAARCLKFGWKVFVRC